MKPKDVVTHAIWNCITTLWLCSQLSNKDALQWKIHFWWDPLFSTQINMGSCWPFSSPYQCFASFSGPWTPSQGNWKKKRRFIWVDRAALTFNLVKEVFSNHQKFWGLLWIVSNLRKVFPKIHYRIIFHILFFFWRFCLLILRIAKMRIWIPDQNCYWQILYVYFEQFPLLWSTYFM